MTFFDLENINYVLRVRMDNGVDEYTGNLKEQGERANMCMELKRPFILLSPSGTTLVQNFDQEMTGYLACEWLKSPYVQE